MSKHIVFSVFAALLIGNAHAGVTFISSCPYTISQPGQYHLAQDLICGSNGIVVAANDVELHFDGHTLTGPGAGFGVLTNLGVSNLTIHGNGTITNFLTGILLREGTSGALIVNMTANNNNDTGIVVEGSGHTLISNTANGNQAAGIELVRTTNNTVRANETDGNKFNGVLAIDSTGNLLQANQAHNNNGGFDLVDTSSGCVNTWKSNHFETSGGPGASCIQ
jgi:parallel beta-helix repeat protein